jgi:DUF438 domain-containing protein
MSDMNLILALLDSIHLPIVFVDNDHMIQFLNNKAKDRYYRDRGYSELVGKSLFHCHTGESQEAILKLYERLTQGENEISWDDPEKLERFTLVAVRDEENRMIGYYECTENMT